ncbi:HSX11 [[Candida] subhashii]|uniref:HSX11 n=1 Tax=[Candida] subhashii TaxID=561895 RepID=A0A8J5QGA7_9ASCO|nr:HSX11 [[Candida] subhashii]KAG7665189.1 HSX11 [[Candida] subhashii]
MQGEVELHKTRGEEINNNNVEEYEGVTIIRPIKGIDPELSSCLESSFCQNYPKDKLQILFCIDNPQDTPIPIIKHLIAKYPTIDAKILISENYNNDIGHSDDYFGPNPKVNNLAKGVSQAKYDILWIMDSNVWASSNILKNSILTMKYNLNNGRQLGSSGNRKVKLVHHVPLALSINKQPNNFKTNEDLEYGLTPVQSNDSDYCSNSNSNSNSSSSLASSVAIQRKPSPLRGPNSSPPEPSSSKETSPIASSPIISRRKHLFKSLGAKLDEMFLHTSHSKFYVALNNMSVAPCVNGKSNIYRKSDLDRSVQLIPSQPCPFFADQNVKNDAKYYSSLGPGHSMKFFSRYIGEDNMIGIALWENCAGRTGLTGDVVVQPLSGSDNTLNDYIMRRVRWLRVRKYMVLLATLIEPTTESIICGLYGTFGLSALFFNCRFYWPWFIFHMVIWCLTDYVQYNTLVGHVFNDQNLIGYVPKWLQKRPDEDRKVIDWLYIWFLREVLALPIWISAIWGHEIDWRGKPFKIKKDLTAEEL